MAFVYHVEKITTSLGSPHCSIFSLSVRSVFNLLHVSVQMDFTLKPEVTVLYLFLRLLLLAGFRWVLGHTQLGGHSGRVLTADRAAG